MRALAVAPSTLAVGAGVTVICAVDSYLDARTLDALDAARRLSREGIRDGFSPGRPPPRSPWRATTRACASGSLRSRCSAACRSRSRPARPTTPSACSARGSRGP
ncbi:MAG: hypothetical protein U0326_19420 [Polyangiales bacterium]